MYDSWDDDLDFTISDGDQYVLFASNQTMFALPSTEVIEIVEFPPITTIAMANSAITGVANIRGNIIAIIDISAILWDASTTITPHTSVIIVRLKHEEEYLLVGLIVDEILEVDTFNPEHFLERPPFGFKIDKKYISSIAQYKENYLMVLDLKHLIDIEKLAEPKGKR